MSPEREVTLGELQDDVRELVTELRRFRDHVDTTFVRRDVYDEHRGSDRDRRSSTDARITAVESRQTLIGRTAVTALMLPVLVAIIVALILTAFPR